ncbi:MAG: acetoin utilization protein AcuC [Chloroflexi bacterium]|nr:acetoin utilization protein AcuC [Chloroflexota bacterium]
MADSRVGLLYHPLFDGRGFTRISKAWRRYSLARHLMADMGLLSPPDLSQVAQKSTGLIRQIIPEPATRKILGLIHTPAYLDLVADRDKSGTGFLDQGDTPAYRGIFNRAATSVGATVLGARLIASQELDHAFNPSGGLHHAQADHTAGFCVFHDLGIAVRILQQEYGFQRIAIVDIDGHHGDGTQNLFYNEPVLTISLHQYDGRFYPRTGRMDEIGAGPGKGYNLNLPLPRRTGHRAYLELFDQVVTPALRAYQPEFLLVQFGTDGHFQDPLVGLRLTSLTYQALTARLHTLAHELCQGKLLLTGGGGYHPEATVRSWIMMMATLVDELPASMHAALWTLADALPDSVGQMAEDRALALVSQAIAEFAPIWATWRNTSLRETFATSPEVAGLPTHA